MKFLCLIVFSFLFVALGNNCTNSAGLKNDLNQRVPMTEKNNSVEFSEVRRLNREVSLKESTIITTFNETLALYKQLDDKKFSRSAPIPTIVDDEFLLVLKPMMKKQAFGDIEVTEIKEINSVLYVYYNEVSNDEYFAEKQKNPILILKIKGNIPKSVKLITVNI